MSENDRDRRILHEIRHSQHDIEHRLCVLDAKLDTLIIALVKDQTPLTALAKAIADSKAHHDALKKALDAQAPTMPPTS